jgi:hypothetical protein
MGLRAESYHTGGQKCRRFSVSLNGNNHIVAVVHRKMPGLIPKARHFIRTSSAAYFFPPDLAK